MAAHPSASATSLPPNRRGRLRNGATPGDFLAAPRCGAHIRSGDCCRQPAMKNGRCRLHGGLSTGPRTAEGRARCAAARRTHGFYSAEMVALRRAGAAHCRRMDALIVSLKVPRTAGHGVLPSNLSNRGTGRADTRPVSTTAAARSAPSASRRLRGESSSARSPSTAGHGVLPPVSHARWTASPAKASSSAPSSAAPPSASVSRSNCPSPPWGNGYPCQRLPRSASTRGDEAGPLASRGPGADPLAQI
jgi:hypothetical protein